MSDESENSESLSRPVVTTVTGVVLAGGLSSRYGTNKALVKVAGMPLIERTLTVMKSVFQHVVLITNTPAAYSHLALPMYEDFIKGLGPVGGIYTALNVIPEAAGFFVACDMPSLSPALIRYMLSLQGHSDVVVPCIDGKIEALHALYTKRCLSEINRLIHSGIYQVFRFFPNVSVRYVGRAEVQRFDPSLTSFFNINRPDELNKWHDPNRSGPVQAGDSGA